MRASFKQKALEYYENAEKVLLRTKRFCSGSQPASGGWRAGQGSREFRTAPRKGRKIHRRALGRRVGGRRTGNENKALEHLNRALTLTIQSGNEEARARVLNAFAASYRVIGKPEDAIRYYQEALALVRKLGYSYGVADDLHGLAEAQNVVGRRSEALKNYREGLRSAVASPHPGHRQDADRHGESPSGRWRVRRGAIGTQRGDPDPAQRRE